MAATKVVVDPITRIEGHLRIEAQAENGKISNAWATSTQFRGIEIIMAATPVKRAGLHTPRFIHAHTHEHLALLSALLRGVGIDGHACQQRPGCARHSGAGPRS